VMFRTPGSLPAGREERTPFTSGHAVHAVVSHSPCPTSATVTATSPVAGSAIGCWSKSLGLDSLVSGPSPHSRLVADLGRGRMFEVELTIRNT
jgi:hypothetical protein